MRRNTASSITCMKQYLCGTLAVAVTVTVTFATSGPVSATERERAEYLSSQCVTCHQPTGHSPGIPMIVGMRSDAFVTAMNAYRQKERPNQIMQAVASSLSDEDIQTLAAYFANHASGK